MFLSKLFSRFKPREFSSKVNDSIHIGSSFGKKAIFVKTVPQSGGEFIFMWRKVLDQVSPKSFHPKNCLMLGVAGGTAINELKRRFPNVNITGVELDPIIIKVAIENSFFELNSNLKIKIQDAIKWVNQDKSKYDIIIVDLYIGDQNPAKARQKPFLEKIKKLLKKDGIVLYNCHYSKQKNDDYLKLRKNIDAVFSEVKELFEFPKNKILLLF